MSKLATLQDFKALMGWSGSENDQLVTSILQRASAIAGQLAGRPLLRQASVTEYPWDPHLRLRCIRLERYPIESVNSVKQLYDTSTDAEFTAEDALTENTDYVIDAENGKLCRLNGDWYARRRHIQVIYTAGYYDPSGSAPTADAIAPPKDLQHGVLMQAVRMYQSKDTAGLRETGVGAGLSLAEVEAHQALVDAVKPLRRSL